MSRLFNHVGRLTLVQGSSAPGTRDTVVPNALVITDLRIQFKIEKSLKKSPNNCEITITNLNPQSRAFCQTTPLKVQLEAGYDNELELVFSGDVRFALSALKGTDWETKLEVGDGEAAFNDSELDRSYGPGTNVKAIVADAAKSMGLHVPTSIADAKDLLTQVTTGAAFSGPASNVLSSQLEPLGYTWSIQDGVLQVLKDTQVRPDEAILISAAEGMKGTPELGKPPKKGGAPPLKILCALKPRLKAGGLIRVQARNVQGNYRVEKLVQVGDTKGDLWESEIEAKPL